MGDEETHSDVDVFDDARDWEGEIGELREEVKRERKTASDAKCVQKSWEREAISLRRLGDGTEGEIDIGKR